MKNNKFATHKKFIDSDFDIDDQLQSEVLNETSNKVDKMNQSNTEIEFVENFNPDDFE